MNEGVLTLNLQFAKAGRSYRAAGAPLVKAFTVFGKYAIQRIFTIPTTDTVLPLANLTAPGVMFLHNTDLANFVLIGSNGVNYPNKLRPDGFGLIEWNDPEVHMIANTAACDVEVLIIDGASPPVGVSFVKVLRAAIPSSSDAYVQKDLGSDFPELWVSFGLGFDAAALAAFLAPYSGDFIDLIDSISTIRAAPFLASGPSWFSDTTGGGAGAVPAPVASAWQICESHYNGADGSEEFYIDDALVYTNITGGTDVRTLRAGQFFGSANANSVAFIGDIRVGTTRGGNDVFEDNFSTNDLSLWDSSTGDVSVVDAPF